MEQPTRNRIRHIFLSPGPNFALIPAADLLGMTLKELKREIETEAIVAVSTRLGHRVTACARAGELATAVPGFEMAMVWPDSTVGGAYSTAGWHVDTLGGP